ncbi:hypothetical protein [Janthinobacterium sp. MDT1-19]|uniref:hypothetical protein n=1 Tax=Janthinobacterium sp. MDT1-19 TaxID=1259339 RepID=UPI003F2022B5
MADTFYDGMPNVNEELNRLVGRGPVSGAYNPAPGMSPMGGPNGFMNPGWIDPSLPFNTSRIDVTGKGNAVPRVRVGTTTEGEPSISLARWLGSGNDDVTYRFVNKNGEFRIEWAYGGQLGYQAFTPMIKVQGITGRVDLPLLKVSSSDLSTLRHNISRGTGQGQEILYVGVDAAAPSIAMLASDGLASWGTATAVLFVGRNSETGRSISTAGTIIAGGADYAEYMIKALLCGTIAPGQVVGIDVEGKLTDKWDRAIAFIVKSTSPCMVGGDTWSQELGARPTAPERLMPTIERELVAPAMPADEANGVPAVDAVYLATVTLPGDTDEDWAAKEEAYVAAVHAFDAALEALRQKVDRIAIAGRVPVNVQGAQPGDYIVPVPDGAGIKGIPVRKADLTHSQYLDAVGRVISIEPDGRAYVMVKVV